MKAVYCEDLNEGKVKMRVRVVFKNYKEMNVRKTCQASENTVAERLRLLYAEFRKKKKDEVEEMKKDFLQKTLYYFLKIMAFYFVK